MNKTNFAACSAALLLLIGCDSRGESPTNALDAATTGGGDAAPPRDASARPDAGGQLDAGEADAAGDVLDATATDAPLARDASSNDAGAPALADAALDAAPSFDAAALTPIADAAAVDGTVPAAPDAGPPPFVRNDGCPADAPLAVNRVRIYPVGGGGGGAKLVGARIQGSNAGQTGEFVDLGLLESAPADGRFSELALTNDTVYRYVRLFDPQGRLAPLAEIEFWHGPVRLTGRSFGTVGAGENEHPSAHATDGDLATYFEGATAGGNYVGLDIGGGYVAAAPSFTPASGGLSSAGDVALASTTPGAQIRFTRDGSTPTESGGERYDGPIRVESGRLTLRAVASASCFFPSEVVSANFAVGVMPVEKGQKSYHLGNSLTDELNDWLEPVIDSTGVDHTYARMTLPGTPIGYLWEKRDEEDFSATPEEAGKYESFVRTFAPDHMAVQPFADPTLATQAGSAVEIFQRALEQNPSVQPWIYAQWANRQAATEPGGHPGYLEDDFARGDPSGGWPAPSAPVANTWEDTTTAQLRYYEAFADYVDERLGGKEVLVVPAGAALAELKRRMDAGQVPGMSDFSETVFSDYLHLKVPGKYLVSLVFYACMYKQSPLGRVLVKPDSMSAEQAAAFQKLAWEVASTYPHSGILTP